MTTLSLMVLLWSELVTVYDIGFRDDMIFSVDFRSYTILTIQLREYGLDKSLFRKFILLVTEEI